VTFFALSANQQEADSIRLLPCVHHAALKKPPTPAVPPPSSGQSIGSRNMVRVSPICWTLASHQSELGRTCVTFPLLYPWHKVPSPIFEDLIRSSQHVGGVSLLLSCRIAQDTSCLEKLHMFESEEVADIIWLIRMPCRTDSFHQIPETSKRLNVLSTNRECTTPPEAG
jgi:hypothetical protein